MRKSLTEHIDTTSLYFNHSLDEHLTFYNSNEDGATSILAIGCLEELNDSSEQALQKLDAFTSSHNDWMFGFLSYDLKNQIENVTTTRKSDVDFPLVHFFVPRFVFEIFPDKVVAHYQDSENKSDEVKALIQRLFVSNIHLKSRKYLTNVAVRPRQSIQEYLYAVNELKKHIKAGDIYEINYCQEFYAKDVRLNPEDIYWRLNDLTKAPFSAFYKMEDKFALCGSPERFLKKEGGKLKSQPIKGTIKRGIDLEQDEKLKKQLRNDPKEQAENVMIVDLVRNDLARVAKKGSVKVDELFGVYTFETVHQLISTVSCEIDEEKSFIDILKATFPMGSMTGAPKIRAIQLADEYEASARGLYAGSIGLIRPNKDFDFNVVIRTLLYNQSKEFLSFTVGGAITDMSKPEKEYDECMLKANALIKAIGTMGMANI
jgi:para-aminobenzoate synthetase component 1